MHSPAVYAESNGDPDDMVYPCKGCGEILEEGKAFELGKSRLILGCESGRDASTSRSVSPSTTEVKF
jgi:hypothetical protein